MLPSTFERDLVGDTSGHEFGALRWLGMNASAAVRRRAGLVLAAASLFIVAMTGTMAFLLFIPVAFFVSFFLSCLDGRARQAALHSAHWLPIRLPDVTLFSDARARNLLERLRRSRQAIRWAVRSGPRGRAFDVTTPLVGVPRLEREVVVLASRIEFLARFLESVPAAGLLDEVAFGPKGAESPFDVIEEGVEFIPRAGRADDPKVKELEARAQVLFGTADEVLRTLEGVPARITALQLRRLESCDGCAGHATADAATFVEGFEALEGALDDERSDRLS